MVSFALRALAYLAPLASFRALNTLMRVRAGLALRQASMPDGTRFSYLDGGQGEPLVLLHGFGGNKEIFLHAARVLKAHYRVIVPDQLGFGDSSLAPGDDYSPAIQAVRLHALIESLGLTGVHLGGSSMGGQIALLYVAQYSDEVGSLWLLSPSGLGPKSAWGVPASELAAIRARLGRNPLIARSAAEFAQILPFVMAHPPSIAPPVLRALARQAIARADHYERIALQMEAGPFEALIDGLATPSLIVWGEQDRVLHSGSAQVLHRHLPNSWVVMLPGVGHMPLVEAAQRTISDYLQFRAAL